MNTKLKLKNLSFVRIQEKPHKLSSRYKLQNSKFRIADKKDIQIVTQILNFFVKKNKKIQLYGGEWQYLNKFKRSDYINALIKNDLKKLILIFSNLFRSHASYGMVTPSYGDFFNKKILKSQILQDIDSSIEFSDLKYLKQSQIKKLSIDKNIGNPYGILIKNKVVMPDTPRHFYFANKIINYAKKKNNFKMLEIGGGYGGLSKILLSFGKNITYFSIDLLEGCFVQYYFLKKAGLKVNLVNESKDIKKNQINLISFDKSLKIIKKIGKCDFVFNSRSFSEMNIQTIKMYTNIINNFIKPNYIYHENSNFLLFPKSKRHLEILGKDIKFNNKYNLEYFNISPFCGGSGRYREFFYKKI